MTDGAGRPVEHRHGALAVLALPNYSRYLAGRFLSSFATQMQTVAVGWLWFKQTLDAPALAGIGMIMAGVLTINLFSKSVAH